MLKGKLQNILLGIFYFFTRGSIQIKVVFYTVELLDLLSCQGDFIISPTKFLALIVSIWPKEYSFFLAELGQNTERVMLMSW